jgi:hypothetical protein
MSVWRREAVSRLPELRTLVERAGSPMALWVDLAIPFEDAFGAGDDDLVRRIFDYAAWCLDTASREPTDASTAAWCAFYEDLPDVPGLVEKLPQFLTWEHFLRVETALRTSLDDDALARVRASYEKRRGR